MLSDRIAQILEETGLKQVHLAAHARVSRSLVTQWLNGTVKSISLDAARNIAHLHGYNPGWVLRGDMPQRGLDSTFKEPQDMDRMVELEVAQAIRHILRERRTIRPARKDTMTPEMRTLVDQLVKIDRKGGEQRKYTIMFMTMLLEGLPKFTSA